MSFYVRLPFHSGRVTKIFLSKMSENTFTILYGSQTGQAKAIAEEICEQADGFDLKAKLLCMSTTDKKVRVTTMIGTGSVVSQVYGHMHSQKRASCNKFVDNLQQHCCCQQADMRA